MLQAQLNNAKNIKPIARKMDRANVESICKHNESIYNAIIANYFEGRNTSCHIGPSTFWVYADSLDDAAEVKKLARASGYINMRTFKPWASDSTGKRISDPKGAYAVDISNSVNLIIGKPATSLVMLLKPFVDVVSEHLVHTYAHLGLARYKFNSIDAANQLHKALNDLLTMTKESREDIHFSLDVEQENGCFDVWTLEVNVK
ncbi:hypothetical protein [Pseudoalteromonas nigrifaciens]|uniref:hypothetical protein n=1 Tax=Pseudoalteromonas nigrifaciens TaxID=28109 RepID=UPI003FD4FE80